MNDQNAYVASLRGYPTTVQSQQRDVYANSKKSPARDHFVEGQCDLRSPKARNDVRMLKAYQQVQSDRLALPRKRSIGTFDTIEKNHGGLGNNSNRLMMTSGQRFSKNAFCGLLDENN